MVGKNSAVFLDRDGVICALVPNPATGEFEAPHRPEELEMLPHALESLRALQSAGYRLFLVSNQPDYAKGKAPLESLAAVHEKFDAVLKSHGVLFTEYYYCHHHPDGVVPAYSRACGCRKPEPGFLRKAEAEHGIDLKRSWFVGDQDADVLCGQACGMKTILIDEPASAKRRGASKPSHRSKNLREAVGIILGRGKNNHRGE
jgi:D-glycero-D-manno-heptose 1,7-bisphosphate phosphatase